MARMLPSKLAHDTRSGAERRFYEALQYLDDEFTVVHSWNWEGVAGRSIGEADFILLHPRLPILVIEVKGGGVEHSGEGWSSIDLGGGWHDIGDPVAQVRDSQGALTRFLSGRVRVSLPYVGYALAFPDLENWGTAVPPGIDRACILTRPDLEAGAIGASVGRALKHWAQREGRDRCSLAAAGVHCVAEALYPAIRALPSLRATIDETRREVLQGTDDQWQILEAAQSNRRLFVRGCVGSGKTVLAQEQARRLAARGLRVQVLCYNRALARHLGAALAAAGPGPVSVKTFWEWAMDVCAKAGDPLPPVFDEIASRRAMPERLRVALASATEAPWDALVVDEGQDFWDEWWAVLDEAVGERWETCLCVFFDNEQTLFCDTDSRFLAGQSPVLELTRNCRNPAPMAKMAYERAGVHPMPRCTVEGPDPRVWRCADEAEAQSRLLRVVREVAMELGDSAEVGSVMLLSLHTFENSLARRISGSLPAGWRLAKWSGASPQCGPRVIPVCTIQAFKGLEADVVVVELDVDSLRCTSATQLVGLTRSTGMLYVVEYPCRT